MSGVDVVDQHLVYYAIGRNGRDKYFFCLFETSIVNAFAIYRLNNPGTKMTHKKFVVNSNIHCVNHCLRAELILNIQPA